MWSILLLTNTTAKQIMRILLLLLLLSHQTREVYNSCESNITITHRYRRRHQQCERDVKHNVHTVRIGATKNDKHESSRFQSLRMDDQPTAECICASYDGREREWEQEREREWSGIIHYYHFTYTRTFVRAIHYSLSPSLLLLLTHNKCFRVLYIDVLNIVWHIHRNEHTFTPTQTRTHTHTHSRPTTSQIVRKTKQNR